MGEERKGIAVVSQAAEQIEALRRAYVAARGTDLESEHYAALKAEVEFWSECAAHRQYDAGYPREEAERLAVEDVEQWLKERP